MQGVSIAKTRQRAHKVSAMNDAINTVFEEI